jgi:uncharacterized phage protein (TIGR01671 family)
VSRVIKFSYIQQHDETGRFVDSRLTLDQIENIIGGLNYKGHTMVARRQFTGLTDKSGKEIFEGDIVSDGSGGIYQVDFPYAGWAFSTAPSSKHTSYPSPWSKARRMEIIGNIYENPELLVQP